MLISALLQLRLKQQCVEVYEASLSAVPVSLSAPDEPVIAGLMIDPQQLAGTRGHTFLATVGQKLHRYWKISKPWLVALRNFLARPFDDQIVLTLGRL